MIDKAIAGASVLAQVVVAKFQDHQPLHRQEGIYARIGVTIARSTMAGWLGQLEIALGPLAALLRERILGHTAIQADETPVPVLAPGTGCTAQRAHRHRLPVGLPNNAHLGDPGSLV